MAKLSSVSVRALVLLAVCISAGQQQQVAGARHRYNVHEPLFGDENSAPETDVHTVSAGTRSSPASFSPPGQTPTRITPKVGSLLLPVEHRPSTSVGQPKEAISLAPIATNLPRARPTAVAELKKSASTSKRQIDTLVSPDASIVQQQLDSRLSGGGGPRAKHWQALDNYYHKMKIPLTWTEDLRTRQPPSIISADSQQKLYDATGSDLQQKQIYTIDRPPISYPLLNSNLNTNTNQRSPFELPQSQISAQQHRNIAPDCRANQLAAASSHPYEPTVQLQQPISDWNLEFPSLPDKIFFNQQQTRSRHQQDTFGSLVDRNIQEQIQHEEMSCGPRNLVRNLAPSSRRQQVAGFGEYPSLLGVYNESQTNDHNFICSATLIHPRFALTLASCVVTATATSNSTNKSLFVRTGDWNVNRKIRDSDKQLVMIVKQVARVHLFPRYQQGNEHDLALLEWTKPIEFSTSEYISPACQAQSRSSLRMRSCWAPVRNITVSAYFDADGDGETKLKQDVQMVEVPIGLISNDDNECRRLTFIESFNFQHPNYICSSDFKQTQWRARLKQSQYLGTGIYCDEGGLMTLVSMMHPMQTNTTADYGYLDLSYYRPWMRYIISSQSSLIRQ